MSVTTFWLIRANAQLRHQEAQTESRQRESLQKIRIRAYEILCHCCRVGRLLWSAVRSFWKSIGFDDDLLLCKIWVLCDGCAACGLVGGSGDRSQRRTFFLKWDIEYQNRWEGAFKLFVSALTMFIKRSSAVELKMNDRQMTGCAPFLRGCSCGLQTRYSSRLLNFYSGLQMVFKSFFLSAHLANSDRRHWQDRHRESVWKTVFRHFSDVTGVAKLPRNTTAGPGHVGLRPSQVVPRIFLRHLMWKVSRQRFVPC